jgi:dTDP-4-amino-4,6-dideoxygalactose transaminase
MIPCVFCEETKVRVVPHNKVACTTLVCRRVQKVLLSGKWAQGSQVAAAEKQLQDELGVPYAALVANGTAALRLTLRALGVVKGDQIVVPAYSCVALPNAVLACEAKPIAIDVTSANWTLDLDKTNDYIKKERPKAIIGIHSFGFPMSFQQMVKIKVPFIEDCSHGIGFGMGNTSGIAILSFYATKFVGAGEGGAVVSRDKSIIDSIKDFRNYADKKPHKFNSNDKMTDIQAAIVSAQLSRTKTIAKKRTDLAHRYWDKLANLSHRSQRFELPPLILNRQWYRFVIDLKGEDLGAKQCALLKLKVRTARPVDPWLRNFHRFPTARYAYGNILSLPLFPTMSSTEQDQVIKAVASVLA